MKELELLNEKLQLLLKKYAALLAENKKLKKTIDAQQKSFDEFDQNLSRLEQYKTMEQFGKTVLSDKEKIAIKKQMDQVIGEIDKLLTTLND